VGAAGHERAAAGSRDEEGKVAMEPWCFKDGTRVWLGGEVEGDSELAEFFRAQFERVRGGEELCSGFGASPEEERLQLEVPHLLDAWLRLHMGDWLVAAPEVEYPCVVPRRRSRDALRRIY